jgi:hypothetical protein
MSPRLHLPTLVAIAVVAYALANVAHEGLGHGGACALVGGTPKTLNAIYFDCDKASLTAGATRTISAAGTLANLALALVGFAALAATASRGATTGRYFLWLFALLNLLQATGYWLFSGLGGVGDWVHVVAGWQPQIAWRIGLAVVGLAGYVLAVGLGLRTLLPFVGADADRLRRATTLTVVPYLAGGILYVTAGLLNPESMVLVLISAAAASFGGASALAWMANLLRNERRFPPATAALAIEPSAGWLTAGAVVALLFVAILGRGIAL